MIQVHLSARNQKQIHYSSRCIVYDLCVLTTRGWAEGAATGDKSARRTRRFLAGFCVAPAVSLPSSVEYMTREEHVAFITGVAPKAAGKSWLWSVSQSTDQASEDANFLIFHRSFEEKKKWIEYVFTVEMFSSWKDLLWKEINGMAAPVGCLMPCAGLLWWLVSCFHSFTATQSWSVMSVGNESLESQKVLHLAHKSWHVAVAGAIFQRKNIQTKCQWKRGK